LDWENASKKNTISAYQEFVEKYKKWWLDCDVNINNEIPEDPVNRALKNISCLRIEKEWNVCKKFDDSIHYNLYLNYYHRGFHLCDDEEFITWTLVHASDRIFEDSLWHGAELHQTILKYNDYIETYPNGKYLADAIDNIKLISDWISTKTENTYQAYTEFRNNNIDSKFADSAKMCLKPFEQKDWAKTQKINTYTAYSAFEKKYTDGYYYDEAEKAIVEMEFAKVKKKSPVSNWMPMKFDETTARDKEFSIIDMENGTAFPINVLLSGPESKRFTILPGDTKTFKLKNGTYTLSGSIDKAFYNPYWGTENFVGYEYSAKWIIKNQYGGYDPNFSDEYLNRNLKSILDSLKTNKK
jgi:hypothetical protein